MSRITRMTRVEFTEGGTRGVYMISIAADMAGMHPQTLRQYEAKGLIEPGRSPKGTRLYSDADIERLKRIHAMTAELGLNLAGVAQVLALEDRLEQARARAEAMEARAADLEAEVARLEELRRELRAEIVPFEAAGLPARRADVAPPATRISVTRSRKEQQK